MNFSPSRLAALVSVLLLAYMLLASPPGARVGLAQKLGAGSAGADSHACSAIEQELLHEINLARTKPGEYASFLERTKPSYSGNEFKQGGGRPPVITVEGWGAVNDAITFLRAAKPAPALASSVGLCCGAGELTRDQKVSGRTGHMGSDGSYCEQRAERFGAWAAPIGENLSYGKLSARERVAGLLIDDGVSNRMHRKRLLDPAFKVVGVACDEHSAEDTLCVITLAGGFKDKFGAAPSAAGKSAPAGKGDKVTDGARRF